MVLRMITGAILALAIGVSPALACKGEEIYSDDFTDPNGPWPNPPWFTISGGSAEIKMDPGYRGVINYLGGDFADFDVCVDITYPQAKNADGGTYGGLVLWFKDMENMYEIFTTPIGAMGAFRYTKGRALLAAPVRKQNALKTGAGATNTLRITAKGGNVTIYANDQRAATFRGVVPEGGGYVGLTATSEQDQANAWKFSKFKLTEAPK
jgi:hypothetical protein